MAYVARLTPESEAKLKALSKAGKIDLRPTLKIIGIGYRKEVGAIFDRKQPRGDGLRWPQLSEQYAKWKAKHFLGAPLLVRTGALKASMISEGVAGNITIIGKLSAVFGSTIPYGIYHDEGSSRTPQRNFSEPNQRRIDIWLKQIEDGIIYTFNQSGIWVNK